MNNRVSDKIKEIEKYLSELSEIVPENVEDYKKDKTIRAACERYFEKIVESVTDLAFILITLKKLELPQDDIDAFRILCDNKFIDEELYKKLKSAKGMRNFIAHQYSSVNDEIVFNSINEEIEEDVKLFLKKIKKDI